MGEDGRDHYEALGVSQDASGQEIRNAYRWLSRKFHPDQNPADDRAAAMMKRINAAYEVVGDPERRAQYDGARAERVTRARSQAPNRVRPQPNAPTDEPPMSRPPATSGVAPPPVPGKKVLNPGARAFGGFLSLAVTILVMSAAKKGCDQEAGGSGNLGTQAAGQATSQNAAEAATSRWVWSSTPDYQIAFPDAPSAPEYSNQITRLGTARVVEIKLTRPSGAFYAVRQTDYPNGSPLSEQGAVDGAIKGASDALHTNVTVVNDQRIMIGNCSGRDFSVSAVGVVLRSLVCVRGSHGYAATVATQSPPSPADAAEETGFLGSFAIVSAPPATAPRNRTKPTLPAKNDAPPQACSDNAPCGTDEVCVKSNDDVNGNCVNIR